MKSDDNVTTRREILLQLGTAVAGLTVNTMWGPISPAEARGRGLPLKHFSAEEGEALETLGDALLPGALEAGIAHYVDDQLGRDAPLLFLKYMDYPGPYLEFYKRGLQLLKRISQARFGMDFAACASEHKSALIQDMSKDHAPGWGQPPASLFYFVLRNDAVDVYYGTPPGFQKLGVPYLPLIKPPGNW